MSGGLSTVTKIKKASTVVKAAVEVTVDASASVAGQATRDGEVSITKTAIDVAACQTIGKSFGNYAKYKATDSSKGKQLHTKANEQKNAARGKSNTTSKKNANVKGTERKLENFVEIRSVATSTAVAGVANSAVEALGFQKKKDD